MSNRNDAPLLDDEDDAILSELWDERGQSLGITFPPQKKHTQAEADDTPHASNPAERCSLCKHFLSGGSCALVSGTIDPDGWCRLFEQKDSE